MIDDDGNIIPLTGTAFTGKGGGFFAYQLFEEGDSIGPCSLRRHDFTPTTTQDQLRLFNLFTDPRQNIGIPFAAAETSPTNLAGATVQPLYLLEDTSDGGRSVWLQTSFLIKGEGTDQQSFFVLALGEQNEEGQLEGVRRGMSHVLLVDHTGDSPAETTYRGQTVNLTGAIATLAGADGETYLFGDKIPHFVIGADLTGNGHRIFRDEPLDPTAFSPDGETTPPPSAFLGATYHIGEQVAQTNAPAPVTTDPDGLDFYGYAAGIYQDPGRPRRR